MQHFLHKNLTLTAFSGDGRSGGFEQVDSTEVGCSFWPSPLGVVSLGLPPGPGFCPPVARVGRRAAAHSSQPLRMVTGTCCS